MSSDFIPLITSQVETQLATFWDNFNNFIDNGKGSALHVAIGIIIGSAFSAVVSSFSNDIMTPVLGIVIPAQLSENFYVIHKGPNYPYPTRQAAKNDQAITWNYGNFLEIVLDFLIISLSSYFLINFLNSWQQQKQQPQITKIETKTCPFCISDINIKARKCPNCTSVIFC